MASLLDQLFDPSMTIEDLDWLRQIWKGPLVVKGIQSVADARRVVDAGAHAIVLSNHGGRNSTELRLRSRTSRTSETRSGTTLKSISTPESCQGPTSSLPSRAVPMHAWWVGRTCTGLMATGRRGVHHTTELLNADVRRTMQLLGVSRIEELGPEHVGKAVGVIGD